MPLPYFADDGAVVIRQLDYCTYVVSHDLYLVHVDSIDGEVRFVSDYEPTSTEKPATKRAARAAVAIYLKEEAHANNERCVG